MADKKNPELIEDAQLDEASGGLLPAIQKVREAAAAQPDPQPATLTKTGTGTLAFGGSNTN
ncbi:MAG TPA: hypothetical protein VEC11_10485 [Allosphingosinicella sp.]|nr:hypothetical protein [Allosphingosinicella sp.]